MTDIDFSQMQQQAAARISEIYTGLAPENLVSLLLPKNDIVKEWQHYPTGDIKDFKHHTQYFYHSHASQDSDRVREHGHFHIFLRKPRFNENDIPVFANQKYYDSNGEKDNLTHLIAIAMNEYGIPTALFTVNHWVVDGIWYDADRIVKELGTFKIEIENARYPQIDQWITDMLILFRPYINELLHLRDEIIAGHAQKFPDKNVFYDRSLEITSVLQLQPGQD